MPLARNLVLSSTGATHLDPIDARSDISSAPRLGGSPN
jgi:hypothetical protein